MSHQLRNTAAKLSAKVTFDTFVTGNDSMETYEPYQGLKSLQQFESSLQHNMQQRIAITNAKPLDKTEIKKFPPKPQRNEDVHRAKIHALTINILAKAGKIDLFLQRSQVELFNIALAKKKESLSESQKDRWFYLEKYQKDYHRLIADLKSKKQFLGILLSRVTNIEEIPSIEQWIEAINMRYIIQLEKQLNFAEWKMNLDKPESPIFQQVTKASRQDAEILRRLEVEKQMMTQITDKSQKTIQSNLSKSQITVFQSGQSSNTFRYSQVSLNKIDSVNMQHSQNNGFMRKPEFLNGNLIAPHQSLPQHTDIMRVKNDQNKTGSILQSQDLLKSNQISNYIIEYSDARTFKTSSIKRWLAENGQNGSLIESYTSENLQPITATPFFLTGSYHPITQSQSSNGKSQQITKNKTETRSEIQ